MGDLSPAHRSRVLESTTLQNFEMGTFIVTADLIKVLVLVIDLPRSHKASLK